MFAFSNNIEVHLLNRIFFYRQQLLFPFKGKQDLVLFSKPKDVKLP
ncbi:hypothetical protein BSM4216_1698 [Bacillus smithii]|nr:hypothetical protein BSM4216_1698 [Bacillus smithii]